MTRGLETPSAIRPLPKLPLSKRTEYLSQASISSSSEIIQQLAQNTSLSIWNATQLSLGALLHGEKIFQNLGEAFFALIPSWDVQDGSSPTFVDTMSLEKCTSSFYSVNPTGLFTNQANLATVNLVLPLSVFQTSRNFSEPGFSQSTVVFCIFVQIATQVSIPRSYPTWQSSQTTRSS
jgi:hypothetical protein